MNGVEAVESLGAVVRASTGDGPVAPENAVEVIITPSQPITDGVGAIRFAAWGPKGPRGVWAFRDCKEGKKDKIRIFKTLAARCAVSVKSMYEDMRDCHSASVSLMEVLKSRGFTDASVVGCSVLAGNRFGLTQLMGELNLAEKPRHSVVCVDGYLIDATVGQFRSQEVKIPDYLVIPANIATPMLALNRHWLEHREGELYMHSSWNGGTDFIIGYIPTEPVYNSAVHGG